MKTSIQRNYDITVYPYDSDEEDYISYHLEIRNITDRFVAMHIIDSGLHDTYMYLANLNDTLLFTDPDEYKGILIPWPGNNSNIIDECLEEIDDYDEEQCAILSSAINTVWCDIFWSQRNVPNANLKPWEE
jgi:hypothetical protein